MILVTAPNHLLLTTNTLLKDFSHFKMLYTANDRNKIVLLISGPLVQSYKAISSRMPEEGGYFYQASGKRALWTPITTPAWHFCSPSTKCPRAAYELSKAPTRSFFWGWSVLHCNFSSIYNSAQFKDEPYFKVKQTSAKDSQAALATITTQGMYYTTKNF